MRQLRRDSDWDLLINRFRGYSGRSWSPSGEYSLYSIFPILPIPWVLRSTEDIAQGLLLLTVLCTEYARSTEYTIFKPGEVNLRTDSNTP